MNNEQLEQQFQDQMRQARTYIFTANMSICAMNVRDARIGELDKLQAAVETLIARSKRIQHDLS